jgi:hypothetical protein
MPFFPSEKARWRLLAFLSVLCLAEFLCFDRQTSRFHTWIYPRWNDQIQYLTESYTGYEAMRTEGTLRGFWRLLVNPSAQGTLHDFYANLVFFVAGPSRSAALAVNLLALIAWQLALWLAVRRHTKSEALALTAFLLPLALGWTWSGLPGSAVDFRLDHLATCAVGVSLATALLTQGFGLTRWSAAFGFAVGLTLLTRFLTGTYFFLIFIGLGLWVLTQPGRWRRFGNLLLAVAVATVVAGPIFWINRDWVWNYYFIGHFTGPESGLRNPHMGPMASLKFVFGHLTRDHLGNYFFGLAAAGSALVVGALLLNRRRAADSFRAQSGAWWCAALYLLAPALILTLHQQKSEIVLGALVPGALLLVILAWNAGLQRAAATWPPNALAAFIFFGAGFHFLRAESHAPYDARFAQDARKVNLLADTLYARSVANHLKEPRVGVDRVTDCLDGQVLRVICYERQHRWYPFIMTLPTGIMEDKPEVLMDRLTHSDFVFLTEDGDVGPWPYDRQMRALLPQHQAWCEAHLRFVERFELFGHHMVLYQRREIQ